ncbi:MAG: hypothetical protein QM648_03650 [Solirubrobacterales bacterium]
MAALDGLADRMAHHGSPEFPSVTPLELAVEALGLDDLTTAEALDALRARADELPEHLRADLTDQGFLARTAA